jgi:hypothetical protein
VYSAQSPFLSPRGVSRGVFLMKRRPERSEGCTACARQDKIGMSPRTLFYYRPEPTFFVTPSHFLSLRALFFVTPSEARGPSALARLGRTGWEMSPRALFLSSRAYFFVAPSRQARGPSALACLGKTWMGWHPEPFFFVAPSLIFCRPEASAEGSPNSFYPLSISLISSSVRSYSL